MILTRERDRQQIAAERPRKQRGKEPQLTLHFAFPRAREGSRAARRMRAELFAPDRARPGGHGAADSFWFYRVVAGAAELGGCLRRRRACNNAVRVARRFARAGIVMRIANASHDEA